MIVAESETRDVLTILAANVLEQRLRRGWSQRELGRLTNTSGTTINNIENARNMPAVDIALRLAIVLDTTVERLCEDHADG